MIRNKWPHIPKGFIFEGKEKNKETFTKKMRNKTDQGTIKRRQRTSPPNWNAHCTDTSHRYIEIHTWL